MQITKDKLNIAVIGGGGREHAIIRRLAQSRRAERYMRFPETAEFPANMRAAIHAR